MTQPKSAIPKRWERKKIKDLLVFERPDKYIVKSTHYTSSGRTPVLTANKSFILGYTDEDFGICNKLPVIIFDDFTTDSKYVDFPFKVKSSAIKILRPKNNKVNLKFVYEKMKSIDFPRGNHKRYYISQYQNLNILVPPFSEQQKIADILSSADVEIEAMDKEIAATECLKRGLMQDLLTRGIGHKKFKKTELGEIPVEWGVVKIKDSGIELVDGDRGVNYPKRSDFSSEGYCLFLNNQNIKEDRFIFDECNFITQEKDEELRKGKLKRSDVILTTRGTVGTVAYYDKSVPYEHVRINSGMLIFRHGINFDPEFLYKFLASPRMKLTYKDMGTGSAQPQLPIVSLKQIKIVKPPKTEQKKIAEILSSVDNKLLISKQLKQKLILLKKGLMRDLLSGKVRVK